MHERENHSRTCFLFFIRLNQYHSRSSRVSAKTITCIISRTNKEEPVSRVPRTKRERTATEIEETKETEKEETIRSSLRETKEFFLSRLSQPAVSRVIMIFFRRADTGILKFRSGRTKRRTNNVCTVQLAPSFCSS